jgi:hypothetical protein
MIGAPRDLSGRIAARLNKRAKEANEPLDNQWGVVVPMAGSTSFLGAMLWPRSETAGKAA